MTKVAVLVMGMHRSGTSLATEILHELGLWIGPEQGLIGATDSNPRGHFELLAGVEFNATVLRQAGGTWDDPPPMPSIDAVAATSRPAIDVWFEGRAPIAFKDPRLCLTLPAWMPALAGYEVRIVHLFRDPQHVAQSLVTRNAVQDIPGSRFAKGEMTAADAFGLWSEYHRRACLYADRFGIPRLPVWYDALVDTPAMQLRRIAEFVDRGDDDIDAAVACVRRELRRHG